MAAQQLTHAVHSGETTAAFANHAAVKLSGSIGTSNDNVHDLAKAAVQICFKQAFPACCCEQDYLTRLPGRRTIPRAVLCPPAALQVACQGLQQQSNHSAASTVHKGAFDRTLTCNAAPIAHAMTIFRV